jgi:hypothetical protein
MTGISDLGDKGKSIGIISANDAMKLANNNNKSGNEIFPSPFSSVFSVQGSLSKTKLLKKYVIHLIRFCLKNGISKIRI